MKKILIAATDKNEADTISKSVRQEYEVSTTESAKGLVECLRNASLLAIDHSYIDQFGNEFLLGLVKRCQLPTLLLVTPEGVAVAMDAIRVGATNYLVKTDGYSDTLLLSIHVTMEQHQEQEKLKDVLSSLQKRVEELESGAAKKTDDPDSISPSTEASILDEIVFIFKQGEINLPSPPQMSIKFKEMVSAGANIATIGVLLRKDAAISSKLISISNSAFYRGVASNKTLEQAIGRLGLTTTKRYVDVITNRTLYFTKNKKFASIIETLWEHSLACAYASQGIADALRLNLPEDAFTLGLLHDIGKLVLFQAVGELQNKKKLGEDIDLDDLYKTVNTNHGRFGAALLKRWKFPHNFMSIANYHDRLEDADPISKELLVIHFANILVRSMGYQLDDGREMSAVEDTESVKFLKLTTEMIDEVQEGVTKQMDELKGFF